MLRISRIALLTVGVLWSAACSADDIHPAKADRESPPVETITVESILAESGYASLWQSIPPVDATAYTDDLTRPITVFDFREASAVANLSRLRSLSLLTLAEIGDTRLFLGINKKGFVGLHFGTSSQYGDERHLEVGRMPYLKKNRRAGEAENLGTDEIHSSTIGSKPP